MLVAPICYFSIRFLKACLNYDDTLNAFGIRGMAGIWRAITTGLFATKSVNPAGNDGLFYGNSEQFLHQLTGVGTAILLSGIGTFVILKVMDMFIQRRVSEEEMMGLDVSFHEEPAYNSENQEKAEEHKSISGM